VGDGERDAIAIHYEMEFGARLPSVGRVAPGRFAPLLARTLKLSRLARLQSIAASSPNQLRSVSCSRAQTPAACQSRRRRQHVVPLPQPSSWDNSRHGHPVRKAKVMPPSAARLGRRGRPPLGLGGFLGSRGSMTSHRASGTSIDTFMTSDHAIAERVLKLGLSLGFSPHALADTNDARVPGSGTHRVRTL
jgi:hypothetical protein